MPSPKQLPDLADRPPARVLKAIFRASRDNAGLEGYFYDFIAHVYARMGLPRESFARQVGARPKTVDIWLSRGGHFPVGARLERLLELYERNG